MRERIAPVALSLFSRKARRRTRLQQAAFPAQWEVILAQQLPCFENLPPADQDKLRRHMQVFCGEKNFEGCGGLVMTDEIRVVIAAQACLLILHKDTDYYPRLSTILVYPSTYKVPKSDFKRNFMPEASPIRQGESWRRDFVILAWDHTLGGAYNPSDGCNLVFHEFAHQLDVADGVFDGIPSLPTPHVYRSWQTVFQREYQKLCQAVEKGRSTLIDRYGATNLAEFFAVTSEVFFERPRELKKAHRELYELLCVFYEQDPLRARYAATLRINQRDWPAGLAAEAQIVETESDRVLRKGRTALWWALVAVLLLYAPFLAATLVVPRHLRVPAVGLVWCVLTLISCIIELSHRRALARSQVTTRLTNTLQLELVEGDPRYGLSAGFFRNQLGRLERLRFRLLIQYCDRRLSKATGIAYESAYVSEDQETVLGIMHPRRRMLVDLLPWSRPTADQLYFLTSFTDLSELVTTTLVPPSSTRPPWMRIQILPKGTDIEVVLKAHQERVAALIAAEGLKPRKIASAARLFRVEKSRYKRRQQYYSNVAQ